jgi:hypothetical protein
MFVASLSQLELSESLKLANSCFMGSRAVAQEFNTDLSPLKPTYTFCFFQPAFLYSVSDEHRFPSNLPTVGASAHEHYCSVGVCRSQPDTFNVIGVLKGCSLDCVTASTLAGSYIPSTTITILSVDKCVILISCPSAMAHCAPKSSKSHTG